MMPSAAICALRLATLVNMFKRSVSVGLASVLLVAGCSGGSEASPDTTITTEAVEEAPATTAAPPETTTTTTIASMIVDGATVVVANASIVGGSAGRMTDELGVAGFTTVDPVNATERIEASIVYYSDADGAQVVAESAAMKLGGVQAAPLPDPIPTESGDIAGADVLVLLGNDQADRTISELSGAEAFVTNGTTIVVANVSGISGSAGRMSTTLDRAGFTVGDPTNGLDQLADSVVHYTDANGAQADAETLAAALGGVEVTALPVDIPTESGEFDGDVLLLLGTDQADQALITPGGNAVADGTDTSAATTDVDSSEPDTTEG
ncbi:MAG: hypothetical protein ACJAR2_002470 [Ilumatobacter sp.]|jgi:hypothetical protein